MDDRISAAWSRLPDYLGQHVILSATALGLGIVLALPLAVAATRSRALRWPLLTAAGLIQTIPSLALLALFYPLLLALSALSAHVLGHRFPALGFLPSVLALMLYAMLPVLRNTVAGLESVPSDAREAAVGVGMTPRQSLLEVELPIAAPVIMAGVRTSAVWVIGAATLSTPVGQTSLGNYIFTGLQTENWVYVLFGCVASASLAMIVDQLLGLVQAGLARRDHRQLLAGAAGLAIGTALALWPAAAAAKPHYVIGAKTFTEQIILSRLLQDQLRSRGLRAQTLTGLGSTVILRALREDEIDAYVEYSGTIWSNAMGRRDNPGHKAVTDGVVDWLSRRYGVKVVGRMGFENAYALAMREDRARALGVRTDGDLARVAPQLVIGGDYEFFGRPEWVALRRAYGLRFRGQRQYQSNFMYLALASDEIGVVAAFSTDGQIAADHLVLLTDPKGAIPPYDALILVAPRRARDTALISALRPLVDSVPVEAIRRANSMVDRDASPPRQAADQLFGRISSRLRPQGVLQTAGSPPSAATRPEGRG
jgi:osmoprotectant transport system permease protein